MGKFVSGINIFKNRPTLASYAKLSGEDKELIDYTIKNNILPNPILRVRKYFRTRHIKPKELNLWSLTWNDIVLIRKHLNDNDLLSFLKLMYAINEKQFNRLDVYNAFATWKWINNEMLKIYEIEVQELEEEIPDEMKDTGIERMEEFQHIAALDKMAGGDLTRYDEFLRIPYSKIFRKLVMEKRLRDINKQYSENVSRKNKRNSRTNF